MSTDPAPTEGTDGAPQAPSDARTDPAPDESSPHAVESAEASPSGLDQTPGPSDPVLAEPAPVLAEPAPVLVEPAPVLAEPATPPPQTLEGDAGDGASPEETSTPPANLAYEDMLARLTAATQVVAAEPETPAVEISASLAALGVESTPPPPARSVLPSGFGSLAPVPARRITPAEVEQPLVADDEDPTIPGPRMAYPVQPVIVSAAPSLPSGPVPVPAGSSARLLHLMLGGMLVLGGMLLAVVVLKLLMPTPVPQPAATIAPPPLPPPTYAPPIQVEPLPTAAPSPGMPASPAEGTPTAARESPPTLRQAGEPPSASAPRSRRAQTRSKGARSDVPPGAAGREQTPALELLMAPKASPAAPSEKEAGAKKGGKSAAYVDPFE